LDRDGKLISNHVSPKVSTWIVIYPFYLVFGWIFKLEKAQAYTFEYIGIQKKYIDQKLIDDQLGYALIV